MYRLQQASDAIRSLIGRGICLSLAWAAGVLVACTPAQRDEGAPDPRGRSRLGAGDACSLDAECQAVGLRCDPERRICVCTSDASCPGHLECDPFSGRCVEEAEGCTGDDDCSEGMWCDGASRACRPLRGLCEPCSKHLDCGPGERCQPGGHGAGYCRPPCVEDGDCGLPGARCEEGLCTPVTDCAALAPCLPDDGGACRVDGDCDAAQRCDRASGTCVARKSGCAFGQRCDPADRTCYTPCDADGDGDDDCGANERCDGKACVPLAPCVRHADCPARSICRIEPGRSEGSCIPGCVDDAACPLGTICGPEDRDGRRFCVTGCDDHGDCHPDQRCEQGRCVRGPGICQTADTCGTCERCSDEGRCVAAVLPGVPETRYCGACAADADCGTGGLCLDGRCAPPCPVAGCPRGFACTPVARGPGEPVLQVCFPNDSFCDTECP